MAFKSTIVASMLYGAADEDQILELERCLELLDKLGEETIFLELDQMIGGIDDSDTMGRYSRVSGLVNSAFNRLIGATGIRLREDTPLRLLRAIVDGLNEYTPGEDYLDVSDVVQSIDMECEEKLAYCLESWNSLPSGTLVDYFEYVPQVMIDKILQLVENTISAEVAISDLSDTVESISDYATIDEIHYTETNRVLTTVGFRGASMELIVAPMAEELIDLSPENLAIRLVASALASGLEKDQYADEIEFHLEQIVHYTDTARMSSVKRAVAAELERIGVSS
jgi:hypothetical protein